MLRPCVVRAGGCRPRRLSAPLVGAMKCVTGFCLDESRGFGRGGREGEVEEERRRRARPLGYICMKLVRRRCFRGDGAVQALVVCAIHV